MKVVVLEQYNERFEDRQLAFYIAHYRSGLTSITLLNYCIRSIKLFYPASEIVVCESPSTVEGTYDISGVRWILSPVPNSSCVGCFKEYLTRHDDKKGIFLHDSMILKGRFKEERLSKPFGFIWSFSCYYEPRHLEHPLLREALHTILVRSDMDYDDYMGCFGFALFGSREAIQALWNAIPFEEYMAFEERKQVMVDLERIVGATAFQKQLVTDTGDCSLCGDIFEFPNAFHNRFNGETYEEVMAYPYEGAVVKFWGNRFINPLKQDDHNSDQPPVQDQTAV